jgi:2-methylcitrate dehydratase PrpD
VARELRELARLVAETRWEDVPIDVCQQTLLVLLDTFGVLTAGALAPEVSRLRSALTAGGGGGCTVVAPGLPTADVRTAALLNGIAARTPELCEGHRFAHCQAAVQVLPTVLAVGEQRDCSGKEAALALMLGYEVAVRLGLAATARSKAHQNGQWPLLGAVAAAARLHGLDADGVHRTLQIAAPLILAPSYSHVGAGATALNVAGGMSAFVGALAPELVASGFGGLEGGVEEAFGELVGDGFDPRLLLEDLGQRWEITRNHFRLRACCNPIYPALDALEQTLAELQPRPEEIESVEAETYRFASLMREVEPANSFAAHYSYPHAAAAVITRGAAPLAAFEADALADPTIAALRPRIRLAEDPALSALAPGQKSARVTLRLKDGRQTTAFCEASRGGFERPYEQAELLEKFRSLAGGLLTPAGVQELESLLLRLDWVPSVQEVFETLERGQRASAER